jgi:ribonuclease BN (tRNA processing enzyme)
MNRSCPGGTDESSSPVPKHVDFSLVNQGGLDLFFLGTGSAFSKKFYQNNLIIVKGKSHLVIDFGSRASGALAALGLSMSSLGNFLVTHSHSDHVGGLEEVMLMNRYAYRKKATMIATDVLRKALWSMSLRGGSSFNEEKEGKYLEFEDFWDTLKPKPIRGADRELCEAHVGDIELRLFRTKHIPDSAPDWKSSYPSYGVIIDRRILFTGDMRYDPEMILAFDAEYHFEAIFHDCQLYTGGVHASLDELAGLPPGIRAKTRLMHYGDKVEEALPRITQLGFAGIAKQWTSYRFPQGNP